MSEKISEKFSELFHYTTAIGLEGIISSQTLRATHYRFVNDSEEYRAYFKVKLREIIRECANDFIAKFQENHSNKDDLDATAEQLNKSKNDLEKLIYVYESIEKKNGPLSKQIIESKQQLEKEKQGVIQSLKILENVAKELLESAKNLEETIRSFEHSIWQGFVTVSENLYEPYLLSFCGVDKNKKYVSENGLLSQWRGYGSDGGYAIVFDTRSLEERYSLERQKYHFQFMQFNNVEYYQDQSQVIVTNSDRKKYEQDLRKGIACLFNRTNSEKQIDTGTPLLAMACSQKHIGFHEENEIRIVAVPTKNSLSNLLAEPKEILTYDFHTRDGLLVPYITLFKGASLPIQRIIIGPHPDSDRRKLSVQKLLEKYNLDIKVTISNIPYIGR